jgi:dephospho-CoA kinase
MPTHVARKIPSFVFLGGFGSGKTYHAKLMKELLEERFGVTVHKVALADEIKRIAVEERGMNPDPKKKDRRLLQLIGAEGRAKDPDYWINTLISQILKNGKMPFVLDDIRLMHEADAFRAAFPNIVLVKIETSDEVRMERYEKDYGRRPTNEELHDQTEIEIDRIKPDIVINNTYSPEGTRAQLDAIAIAIETDTLEDLRRKLQLTSE